MRKVTVSLKKRSYPILIGRGLLGRLGKLLRKADFGTDAYCVTNARIKNKYGRALAQALSGSGIGLRWKIVPEGEGSKSTASAFSLLRGLAAFDRKRRVFIIAFGGGVIGDLAGFAASIYKRGIPYIQVPTTLLAQVDSSIGGKTAVDLAIGKNLLGAIYQPKMVLSDISLLGSLDARQISSGLAEVIKYAAIKDKTFMAWLERNIGRILSADAAALEYTVYRCSRIKAAIVSRDETEEKGLRTVLNFGHTIGHALEAAGGYRKYNHGEAVALGMLAACALSSILGRLPAQDARRIESLIRRSGLPVRISKINPELVIRAHYRDKKFIGAKNRFVLLDGIGRARLAQNLPLGLIRRALQARIIG